MQDFAHSTRLLWTGKAPKKLSRWTDLCRLSLSCRLSPRLSQRILDFEVKCLDAHSLRYLYREIFVNEEYLFQRRISVPK